tara:strand:+ start:495 stop:758 length:264 start_codon:yes stop_codon:yes gene_type:complete
MEILLLLLILYGIYAIGVFLYYGLKNWIEEEGTLEERETNPELNTNDRQLHSRRLYKYKFSKCRGTTYFEGPRGGVFYFRNGKKVYV